MPKKTKTYSVEVSGTVEVNATFVVEADSEIEANNIAEQLFEDHLVCKNEKAEYGDIDWSCSGMDSNATEEEEE